MASRNNEDGVNIYYKDWGPKENSTHLFSTTAGRSVPDELRITRCSSSLCRGYRVIAIDRSRSRAFRPE